MKKKIVVAVLCVMSCMLTACSLPAGIEIPEELLQDSSEEASSEDSAEEEKAPEVEQEVEEEELPEASTEEEEQDSQEQQAAGRAGSATVSADADDKPLYRIAQYTDHAYCDDEEGENFMAGEYRQEALLLMEECRDQYPELYEVLHKTAEEKRDIYLSEHKDFCDYAVETTAQSIADGYKASRYYVTTDIYVKRTADQYLSYIEWIEYRWEEYKPYKKIGHNLDITTGEEIDLGDVLNIPEDELNTILADKLREDHPDELEDLENVEEALSKYHYGLKTTDFDDKLYDWFFSVDGVHFVFNAYDIVDKFSFGSSEIVMAYDEGYVKDEYIYAPEGGYSYAKTDMFIMDEGYYSGGRVSSPLLMYAEDDNDEDLAQSLILVNGTEMARFDDVCFDYDNVEGSYDIFTPDGKEYIYVIIDGMAEEWYLFCFDISDGGAKACGYESYYEEYFGYADDPDYYGSLCITDPDMLMLPSKTEIFGSMILYTYYYIGSDGLPRQDSDVYNVGWVSNDIKTADKIDAYEVAEDGAVSTEATTLKKGTKVKPVHTDNKTYIDCRLDDGSMVRFLITVENRDSFIDGKDIDDLFDGLVYAG